MNKLLNVRRILSIFLLIFLLFSIINIELVLATDEVLKLTNVTISEKSDTAEGSIESFDSGNINTNITFHKLEDYVVYKLTFKNNSDEDYTIKFINVKDENDYIRYVYDSYQEEVFKANDTKNIYIKNIYKNEVEDMSKRKQDSSANLSFKLVDKDGNEVTQNLNINPKTEDNINKYIILGVLSIIILIAINSKRKSYKKISLLLLLVIPMITYAIDPSLEIKFNSKLELKDKLVTTYYVDGDEVTGIVNYDEKIEQLEEPNIPGYKFRGWYDGDKEYHFDSKLKDDIKLTAKLELINYTIDYNLNGGSATNPSKYTVENDDITLNNPTKKGYSFSGWTGSNGENLQTRVTVEKGSIGNKTYTANFSPNEDTTYKVIHKYKKLDGTFDIEEENLTGTTDTTVRPQTKSKVGFVNPDTDELTITPDGLATIEYEYGRVEYQLTLTDSEYIETNATTKKYPYETEITLTAKDRDNFEFVKWSNNEITKTITISMTNDIEIYPIYEGKQYKVTYNANGGNFYNEEILTNEVNYKYKDKSITKYSSTSNINNKGEVNGNYPNNQATNDTVTIPGADSLHVKLTYGTESYYDYLYVFDYEYDGIVNDYLKGYKYMYTGERENLKTVEFDIEGDTVTFSFFSNWGNAYYGYYAEVTGYINYELLNQYKTPTKKDKGFKGWYLDGDCIEGNEFNINDYDLTEDIEVYAKWEDGIAEFVDSTMFSFKFNYNSSSFIRSEVLPVEYNLRKYLISSNESDIPIYMWYESDTQTTKWYSDSTKVYLNKNSHDMFYGMTKLTKIDLDDFDTSNVTNMSSMFAFCENLSELDLSNFDTRNVTSMEDMFNGCKGLTELDLSSFDTRNVTNMRAMFNGCNSLTKLNVSSFNTSNVTNMSAMFKSCSSLTKLELNNFNTRNVTYMDNMFYNCESLTKLDLSSFNTKKVTEMELMFAFCENLSELDLSSFDTSNVKYMNYMFNSCSSLKELDLSSFDTSNVTFMDAMFGGCSSLTRLNLSNFDTKKVISISSLFYDCPNLRTIKVSEKFITDEINNYSNMFYGDINLVGGNGTLFDPNHIDKEYAHIDGGINNPGYFTYYKNKYIVTFDPTDGQVTQESISVYEEEIINSFPIPTRRGYNFVGWYIEDELIEAPYTPTDNITLTAHWEKIEGLISYTDSDNDGEISIGDYVRLVDDGFYVIGINGENVKLIAEYNLDSNSRQAENDYNVLSFSESNYWYTSAASSSSSSSSNTDNPFEGYNVDESGYPYVYRDGNNEDTPNNFYSYINNYLDYLTTDLGINNIIDARLMSYKEAYSIGCELYNQNSCPTYVANQTYYLGTAGNDSELYVVSSYFKNLSLSSYCSDFTGIRPVIEIKKSEFD